MMMKALALLLLLSCGSPTSVVKVVSEPEMDVDGVIQTQLDLTVSLTCRAELVSGLTPEELEWQRNGAAVLLTDNNKWGLSNVCVMPVTREDNAATFSCHLKGDRSVNASVTLNVTYDPMLSGTEEVTVEEEEELVLQCDVRANPSVALSWQRDGGPLDLSQGGFMVSNDGLMARLAIHKVARNLHQGLYRCVSVSPIYGTHSKSFLVTVSDKTMPFPLMPLVAGLVVVACTCILAIVSRWKKIVKCCK